MYQLKVKISTDEKSTSIIIDELLRIYDHLVGIIRHDLGTYTNTFFGLTQIASMDCSEAYRVMLDLFPICRF